MNRRPGPRATPRGPAALRAAVRAPWRGALTLLLLALGLAASGIARAEEAPSGPGSAAEDAERPGEDLAGAETGASGTQPPAHQAYADMPELFARRARLLSGDRWLVGYHYERESRAHNRTGTRRESVDAVLARGFTFASYATVTETHSVELLYAAAERLTLAARLPFVVIEGRHREASGRSFTTHSEGLGDLELGARLRFIRKRDESLNFHLTMQLPTGKVDARDDTPVGRVRLPYDQQPGSGTWNLFPGMTYVGQAGETSWGVQVGAEFYLFHNSHDWTRGDVFLSGGWLAHRWLERLTTSLRIDWRDWQDIRGRDDHISRTLFQAGDPSLNGGARLELGTGLALEVPGLRGQRVSVDASWPVYQSLDGPQLESRWRLQVGWEWAFSF